MSMLSSQIDELREAARNIQGKLGRCLYGRKDVDEMQQVSSMLREAADTILSLQERLQRAEDIGECEKLPSLTDAVCIVQKGGMEMHFGFWRCSKCGCENFEGAKHCMNCGRKAVKR